MERHSCLIERAKADVPLPLDVDRDEIHLVHIAADEAGKEEVAQRGNGVDIRRLGVIDAE